MEDRLTLVGVRRMFHGLLVAGLHGCGPEAHDVTSTDASTTSTTSTSGTTTTTTDDAPPTTGSTGSLPDCLTKFEWYCRAGCSCPSPTALPHHDCGGSELCPSVAIEGMGPDEFNLELDTVDTQDAALCILQALRDRTPGHVRILWGDVQGFKGDAAVYVDATVFILGDETVLMNWTYSEGCGFEEEAVSRRVLLRQAEFFDACLADPSTTNLIACFTEGATISSPDPPGWLPPWTLGACDDNLPAACP